MAPAIIFEKQPLLTPTLTRRSARVHKTLIAVAAITASVYLLLSYTLLLGYLGFTKHDVLQHVFDENGDYGYLCPQADVLVPTKNAVVWDELVNGKLTTPEFKAKVIAWLSGAVQVKTESYDKMGPIGVDPRWDAFGNFHDYLLESFPLIHKLLSVKKVNTWGLVYIWKGSDDSLKPALFAAHQDVVPVNPDTEHVWAHPPYSGYFDGERIWGRGSSDDKSGLITLLASIETLVESGFQPTRTIVAAFGFDEEASGMQGANSIANHLISEFGENAFAFIVDEGSGYSALFGTVYAGLGVVEKGYIDIRVVVTSPGGHSSTPPVHTSIGLLAALLVEYEANPYLPRLSRNTVSYDSVKCWAAHSPKMPSELRKAIVESLESDRALEDAESILFNNPAFKTLVGTTQAIDLIGGGVKTNALPENAFAVLNHRIAIDSSVADVVYHDTAIIKPLAEKFNLSFTSFGTPIIDPSRASFGSVELSNAWGASVEPSPVTPYSLEEESAAYQLLSGTIKSAYNAHRGLNGSDNIKIQPIYMTGNTDTRYYWKLTDNIFRYNHHDQMLGLQNIHTVNESIRVDNLFEMVKFFTTLILNADEINSL